MTLPSVGSSAELSESPRVDAYAKVTGRATYVEDLPEPEGTSYAVAIRSPYSHARILSIDSSAAESLPGVLGILHSGCLAGVDVRPDPDRREQKFLATEKARFDGDLIGMVAAADLRTARRAAELVQVEYELLTPVFSFQEAMAPGAPLVHEHMPSNLVLEDVLEWGNLETAFASAAHVFDETLHAGNVYHHPMEPPTSLLVTFDGTSLDCWMPTNHPYEVTQAAEERFGISPENVRVRVPAIGGSFGSKDVRFSSEVIVTAALSRKIGRPVKLIASEEDGFRTIARHAITYQAKVGLTADGRISALDVFLEIDTGAYFAGASSVTSNSVTSTMGAYRIPNFRCRAQTAFTNKVPAATFRNTGKNQTVFAIECMMDDVARRLRLDPIEFRQKNLLRRGDHLAPPLWTRKGKPGDVPPPPIDTDVPELLQLAVDAVWQRRPGAPSPAPARDSVARGRGVAVSIRRSSESGVAEAVATLEPDGFVAIGHNAPDVGEGSHTMIREVAARTLGLPVEQVRVAEPDTGNKLFFTGTSSQRTTVQMGTAVKAACEELKAKMLASAAETHGGDGWQLMEGQVTRPGLHISLADLSRSLEGRVLSGEGAYSRSSFGERAFGGNYHWTPGAAAVEVEVDRDTGEVRVLQYAAVADAGKALHYKAAAGQIEGGAVMGLGLALFEDLCYRDGQLQNADAFQYRLPLMRDVPEAFSTTLVEHGDGPGPFGAKAIAQTSIPCAGPAICNAIYDAVGVRIRSTPITPEKVLRAIGELRASG